jgi:FAD-dependent oxidoreductase domain-containing protein 1
MTNAASAADGLSVQAGLDHSGTWRRSARWSVRCEAGGGAGTWSKSPMRYDLVIVGGGVIGCSVAYHVALLAGGTVSVLVVEKDPSYRTASSALSLSSIRQQFSTPLNIAMSRYGWDFIKAAGQDLRVDETPVDPGLVERGYLFLATAQGAVDLRANVQVQRGCGAQVALMDAAAIQRRFASLRVDDLAAGALGLAREGWFDGYSLLQALKRKAIALGVTFRQDEAVAMRTAGGRIEEVSVASGETVACGQVVCAAGPRAAAVAAMAGVEIPVFADKRCVFVVDCPDADPDWPLVIDPSGVYFRPEGRYVLAGAPAVAQGAGGMDLEVDHDLFETLVWPALAHRSPAFETLKVISAWAGHYEMNGFDQNAIIGAAPGVPNLLLANGFSGHGMQQAPAAGRALAELIVFGRYQSLDLTPFSCVRIAAGRPIAERNIV